MLLPADECRPIAFGIAMKAGAMWSDATFGRFQGEFLPAMSSVEHHMLDAAICRRLKTPDKLPTTVEDYSCRIWQRAVAHHCPARLHTAVFQATRVMAALLVAMGCQEEEPQQEEDEEGSAISYSYPVSVGNLDQVFDLVGIPPSSLDELKDRIVRRIQAEFEAGNFRLYEGQAVMVNAWRHSDSEAGHQAVGKILDEALKMRDEFIHNGGGLAFFRTIRHGRFLLRLGLRREAMRCAKAIAASPWDCGWQSQSLQPGFHSRIRKLLIRPGMQTDRWLTDPALASSDMSVPLWLKDGVCRLPELSRIFEQARAFPWIFPKLHQIFQWHLALAGNQQALREIATIDPDGDVGLAAPPAATI